jgi:predicted nucleic acid-binding protein
MQPALFDTSIYISALRRGDAAALALRRLAADAPLWLSAVVLEELYAGAGDRERRVVERLERDFDRAKRILVPNLSDWTQAGRVLARLAAKYDYEPIGQGRLTNDALIAMSAGRLGIRVMTTNERDYRRLAEFRVFQWRVTTVQDGREGTTLPQARTSGPR